ncbi:MAG: flippase [Lentisphaeraceae bacterium]|nr:flippase [Lentisphaeraceae bacterium]
MKMSLMGHGMLLSLAKFAEKGTSFFVVVLIARFFGSEGAGEFFYYFSLASLFIPMMDMGFKKLLLQEWDCLDQPGRKNYLSTLIYSKVICGISALSAGLLVECCSRGDSANFAATCAAFAAIYLDEFGQLLRAPDHARERFGLEGTLPPLARLLTLAGVFIFAGKLQFGWQVCWVYAAANGLIALFSLAGCRGCWPSMKAPSVKQVKNVFVRGFPFSMTSLFVMISFYVDSVMLGHFSIAEVGLYNASYRIIIVAAVLSGGLCHVLFPRISRLSKEGEFQQCNALLSTSTRLFILVFGGLVVGALLLGNQLMPAVYGEAFEDSGILFVMLAPLILLASLTSLYGLSLEAMGLQKVIIKISMFSASFNVLSNLIFIPYMGAQGAAITTVLTELLSLVNFLRYLNKLEHITIKKSAVREGLLWLIPLSLLLLPLSLLDIWLALPIGGTIWVVYLWGMRKLLLGGTPLAEKLLKQESEEEVQFSP